MISLGLGKLYLIFSFFGGGPLTFCLQSDRLPLKPKSSYSLAVMNVIEQGKNADYPKVLSDNPGRDKLLK